MTPAEAALVDRIALAIAQGRVPSHTVYMDGSHNPLPSEYLNATRIVQDMLDNGWKSPA